MASARRQAITVAPRPNGRLNFPAAESAPAASSQGKAGTGNPICSTNTAANTSGKPYLMRNWVVSDMITLRRGTLFQPNRPPRSGPGSVDEVLRMRNGDSGLLELKPGCP